MATTSKRRTPVSSSAGHRVPATRGPRMLHQQPPATPTALLTADQVAAELHIHRITVYKMIAARQIESVRLNSRTVRIKRSELDRVISTSTRPVNPKFMIGTR
ncbi:MAG TPA: helix-turn-helix domain-containing protein [Terracidiphilus sp.]|nr:helix-turn-helix domain-containing protein [Terracidiphilus sp.]